MNPEQLQEFERLLTDYGAAVYDKARLEALVRYPVQQWEHLAAETTKAREAVIAFVKELVNNKP